MRSANARDPIGRSRSGAASVGEHLSAAESGSPPPSSLCSGRGRADVSVPPHLPAGERGANDRSPHVDCQASCQSCSGACRMCPMRLNNLPGKSRRRPARIQSGRPAVERGRRRPSSATHLARRLPSRRPSIWTVCVAADRPHRKSLNRAAPHTHAQHSRRLQKRALTAIISALAAI
jgi:hypothetical protein